MAWQQGFHHLKSSQMGGLSLVHQDWWYHIQLLVSMYNIEHHLGSATKFWDTRCIPKCLYFYIMYVIIVVHHALQYKLLVSILKKHGRISWINSMKQTSMANLVPYKLFMTGKHSHRSLDHLKDWLATLIIERFMNRTITQRLYQMPKSWQEVLFFGLLSLHHFGPKSFWRLSFTTVNGASSNSFLLFLRVTLSHTSFLVKFLPD